LPQITQHDHHQQSFGGPRPITTRRPSHPDWRPPLLNTAGLLQSPLGTTPLVVRSRQQSSSVPTHKNNTNHLCGAVALYGGEKTVVTYKCQKPFLRRLSTYKCQSELAGDQKLKKFASESQSQKLARKLSRADAVCWGFLLVAEQGSCCVGVELQQVGNVRLAVLQELWRCSD
jgi:hypothetical protein